MKYIKITFVVLFWVLFCFWFIGSWYGFKVSAILDSMIFTMLFLAFLDLITPKGG